MYITQTIFFMENDTYNLMICFAGEIIHSVKYKDVLTNHLEDKRVLVVGIGNSAVDAAVNIAAVGRFIFINNILCRI